MAPPPLEIDWAELFKTAWEFLEEYNVVVMITLIVGFVPIIMLVFDTQEKALDKEAWKPLQLIQKEALSHDTRRFRFKFPNQKAILGLPIGQHIAFKYIEEGTGKEIIRSYTPTKDGYGYVDFVLKIYFANVHPKFPEGGKMSQYLENMKIGDTLLMRGPKGHLEYQGKGKISIRRKANVESKYKVKKIGMIAGGTGITPMLQVISAILNDENDKTEMWLIFANQTEDDILLRKELESFQSDRFHLWYTLDRPPEDWKYSSGFIDKDMCAAHLPPKVEGTNDTILLCCGPPPMIKFACEPAFKELGFVEDDYFSF